MKGPRLGRRCCAALGHSGAADRSADSATVRFGRPKAGAPHADVGVGVQQRGAAGRAPLVQHAQRTLRRLVVLAFQLSPPAGHERGQRARLGVLRSGQELVPHGAEEALDLALADGLVGVHVDQMHVEGGDRGREADPGVQPRPVAQGPYGAARAAAEPAFRRPQLDGFRARLARRRQAVACSARRTVVAAVYGDRRRHRIKSCSLPVRYGAIRLKTAISQRIHAIYNPAS